MKRDPDLLRDQLIFLQDHLDGRNKAWMTDFRERFPDVDEYVLGDHVHQLCERGFLDGKVHFHNGELPPKIVISRITDSGHDFLSAVADDKIWKKAVREVGSQGKSWTLQILYEYAKALLAERLGFPSSG